VTNLLRSVVAALLSAIAAAHRSAGHKLDTRARERSAMKGIRKACAAPQAQVEALKPAMVRDDSPLERRDAAVVALLFAAALRRSELARLGYAQVGVGDGYLRLTAGTPGGAGAAREDTRTGRAAGT